MAGAFAAVSSQALYAQKIASQAGDGVPRPSSISKLCITRLQLHGLRLRAHKPLSSGGCFDRACCLSNSGLKFDRLRIPLRELRLTLAASLDDSASIRLKGSEVEKSDEGLNKPVRDLADFADEARDTLNAKTSGAAGDDVGSVKAKADQIEDNSESSNKFIGVLRDTTEELKQQAEKARAALTVTAQETAAAFAATAQETAERSKENLSYIAENAPDPIREIADTALKAHSADTPKKFAKIHDFCLGIPYGTFLAIGGLLWFIISGSTAAIRFGVILGGILLGLSVSSLNAWKQGKPTGAYIKGQAAVSSILAFREVRRLFEVKASFPGVLIALISTGMLGFYCYVLLAGGNPPKKEKKHAPAT